MLKRRVVYGILLLALVIAEIYVNNVYSLLLFLICIFLPMITMLFARLSYKGLGIELKTAEVMTEGESAELIIEFSNSKLLALAVVTAEISVFNTLTGSAVTQRITTSVGGKSTQECVMKIENAEVGHIFVTVNNIQIWDLFKLASFSVFDSLENSFLVRAREIAVSVNLQEANETDGESVKFSEHFSGRDTSETFDIRDYHEGDEPRSVHWKLSGKIGNLMVREFSRPLNYSVIVLADFINTDPRALASLAVYTANMSKGLLNAGVMHTLAFSDAGTEEFVKLNITCEEERELAELRLISVCCSDENEVHSIDRYLMSAERDTNAALFYLTTKLDVDTALSVSMTQEMKIYTVGYKFSSNVENELPIEVLPDNTAAISALYVTI